MRRLALKALGVSVQVFRAECNQRWIITLSLPFLDGDSRGGGIGNLFNSVGTTKRPPRRRLSYGDYVEQLTYLLFLKMAHEQTQPPYRRLCPVGSRRIAHPIIPQEPEHLLTRGRLTR